MPELILPHLADPSFASGYARSAGESANPGLWKGLVGLWVPSLGPSGNTLFDVSGHDKHGTLNNMNPSTDWVVTEKGWSLDFDGADDFVSIGESPLQPPITIFAIVRQSDVTRYGAIVATGNMSNAANYGAMLQARSNGAFAVAYGKGEQEDTFRRRMFLSADSMFSANEWVSLCGVIYSLGDDMALFLNGRPVSGTYNGTASDDIIYDGVQGKLMHGNNNYILGQLAMGIIWNRALLPSEIQQLFVDPFAPLRLRRRVLPAAVVTGRMIVHPGMSGGMQLMAGGMRG